MKEKPTPRDDDSRTYSCREYQCDAAISIFINIVINFSSAALFLSTYISRKHIANYWKAILLNLTGKTRTLEIIMVF